jgi:hypothetical protein
LTYAGNQANLAGLPENRAWWEADKILVEDNYVNSEH